MKMLWNVIVGFILINLLAAAGFVGWMYIDGRINRDRIETVVDTFKLTIDQEKMQQANADAVKADAIKQQQQQARLESTAKGPVTLDERLDNEQQMSEVAKARIQLLNEQNKALREEMDRFQSDFSTREAKLESDRAAFEKWIQDESNKTKDENFLQVVSLYEKQPPKQTKLAFQTLMGEGETGQVVDYLAAMSGRKAAAVLTEFKAPAEVAQAAQLLEQLRMRGRYDLPLPQAQLAQEKP